MHRKRLITLGLLVVLAGLIMLFPARVAYRWFAPEPFVASGISGTIWSGKASEATANGFYLRDLNWTFRPLKLFTGKVAYSVESKFASGFMQGQLGLGFGGSVYATGLRAALPLEAIQSIPAIAGSRGMLTLDFEQLKISDGLPVIADGYVELADLMNPLLHREPIGGFRADFFSQDPGISASIEDTTAVIDLAGSLQLAADGSYQFLAQLGARESTPQSVRDQLRFLGPANDRGQHELRLEGKL